MFQKRITSSVLALTGLAVSLSIAGCGGGGGSSSSTGSAPGGGDGGTGTIQTFGALTAHVTGAIAPPVTASGNGVVVTGVYGASITSLVTAPSANIADTTIVFDHNGTVMGVSPNGGNRRSITTDITTYGNTSSPTWIGTTGVIAFQRYDPTIGRFQIYTVNADGTNEHKISTGGFNDTSPSASPSGRFIAFTRADGTTGRSQVWLMYANGTSPKRISDLTANDYYPSWSPDSLNIAFSRYVNSHAQLYVMGYQGTVPHSLTASYTSYDALYPAYSPDGSKIAFSFLLGTYYNIYQIRADGTSLQATTYNGSGQTYNDYTPTYSPDGSQIAFTRGVGSAAGSIWLTSVTDGSTARQLTYNAGDTTPSWSPFVSSSLLIGTGGSMGTSAGGFLYGQQGTKITSLVTFDARTRSGLSVTSQTGVSTNGPNVVFGIDSTDSLTSLVYRNGSTTAKVTVIGAGGLVGATATNAIVSYDANTGLVASVLPYTATASAVANVKTGALKPSIAGNVLTYHAKFIGAWDGAGKNLAPNGAANVQIDGKTGKLISVK